MLVQQSERARWYLGLQRLFNFPRTSVAPVSLRLRVAHTKSFGGEVIDSVRRPSSGNSFSAVRSRPTEVLLPPVARSLTSKNFVARSLTSTSSRDRGLSGGHAIIDEPGKIAPHQLSRQVEGKRARPIYGQRLSPLLSSRTIPSSHALSNSINLRPGKTQTSLRGNSSQISAAGSRLSHWLSAAGLYKLSAAGSDDLQRGFAPLATFRGNDYDGGSEGTERSFDDTRMPSSQRRLASGSIDPASAQAGTEGRGAGGTKTAVSTLHIDGSSLGRWALQHLERSLGKPTSGMTGIDPRATPPRSRVSPF